MSSSDADISSSSLGSLSESYSSEGEFQTTDLRTYIFGHSLISQDYYNVVDIPSQETSIPHWMVYFAAATNVEYAVSGQYGFLPQHDDLPPTAQWGFDLATPAWDSDYETFAEADCNTVLLTAGNFIQYKPSHENYDGRASDTSPLQSTLNIFDWVETQEPGMKYYVYENWPDMAGYIQSWPASSSEFDNYNEYGLGDFHDWWVEYVDSLQSQRPDLDIEMIRVGPVLVKIFEGTQIGDLPITELYEDDAPHGRATTYFLASLITYRVMYGVHVPSNIEVPETVNAIVATELPEVMEIIERELDNFL